MLALRGTATVVGGAGFTSSPWASDFTQEPQLSSCSSEIVTILGLDDILGLLISFKRRHLLGISSYEAPDSLGGCSLWSASTTGLQETAKLHTSDLRKESQEAGPQLGTVPQVPQLPKVRILVRLWSMTGPGPHPGSATYHLLV